MRTLTTLRANDYILVDGVRIAIRWTEVGTGSSFFIPCVNAYEVVSQVRKYFNSQNWKMKHEIKVENDYFGVRIWRTL